MGYTKLKYDDYKEDIDYWLGCKGVLLPLWAEEISLKGCIPVSALDFYDDITMTDVENILNNYDAYNNTADYRPTNQNCNTFTNTINEGNFPASMADTNTLQLFIGIYYTLDRRYFE